MPSRDWSLLPIAKQCLKCLLCAASDSSSKELRGHRTPGSPCPEVLLMETGPSPTFCEIPEVIFIRFCFKFATLGLCVDIKHTNTVVSVYSVAVCASKPCWLCEVRLRSDFWPRTDTKPHGQCQPLLGRLQTSVQTVCIYLWDLWLMFAPWRSSYIMKIGLFWPSESFWDKSAGFYLTYRLRLTRNWC